MWGNLWEEKDREIFGEGRKMGEGWAVVGLLELGKYYAMGVGLEDVYDVLDQS